MIVAWDRIAVRWIAAGAVILFLSVFAADRLITAELAANPESSAVLQHAFERMNHEIDDEEKTALRQGIIAHLATPEIIFIIAVVLLLPFWTGVLLGIRTSSHWNAVVAGLTGAVLIVIHMLGEFSPGAVVLVLFVLGETTGGSVVASVIVQRMNARAAAAQLKSPLPPDR